MGHETNILCRQCRQPIAAGEDFVCFKVPGKESYEFFHYRLRAGDCWEKRLKQGS